ncbi:MAG: hypothetical protein WAW23_09770, partial [Candidatus Methanoperedens sp.]
LGGFVNALLLDRDLLIPRFFRNSDGYIAVNAGFLSNVMIGAAASVLTWMFGANDLPPLRQIGLCFLAGIGGGNIISSMLQNKQLILQQSKIADLAALLGQSVEKLADKRQQEHQETEAEDE